MAYCSNRHVNRALMLHQVGPDDDGYGTWDLPPTTPTNGHAWAPTWRDQGGLMAIVWITHHYDDGNTRTDFGAEVDEVAYPQVLAEAKATVLAMYRECVGIAEDSSDGQ